MPTGSQGDLSSNTFVSEPGVDRGKKNALNLPQTEIEQFVTKGKQEYQKGALAHQAQNEQASTTKGKQ